MALRAQQFQISFRAKQSLAMHAVAHGDAGDEIGEALAVAVEGSRRSDGNGDGRGRSARREKCGNGKCC